MDHSYRDYSRVTARELLGPAHAGRVKRKDRFPAKLHALLAVPAYADIVRWRVHGRAWAVVDRARFEAVVMPRYFDTKSYASFNRSVNGWGFKVSVCRCLDWLALHLRARGGRGRGRGRVRGGRGRGPWSRARPRRTRPWPRARPRWPRPWPRACPRQMRSWPRARPPQTRSGGRRVHGGRGRVGLHSIFVF